MQNLIRQCEKAYGEKDYSRLESLCAGILEDDKNNETALTYQLYVYCNCRQYHLVFRIADRIHTLYPSNYHAYNGEAIACMCRQEFEDALDCCCKGLKIKDYWWLRLNKIEALISLNRIDEAYDFYATSEIPDYNFTKALINCGKYSEISKYEEGLSDDELVEYLLERCFDLDSRGNREEILRVCDEIFKLDKDNEAALIYKVYALAFLGRDEELLKFADLGIELYPKTPTFYLEKADVVYYYLKDLDGAIELYEKGLSLHGDIRQHWAHIDELTWALNDKADELIESGKYEDAVLIYDKILYYRPEEFEALDKIDSLTKNHNIDYDCTEHYMESLKLKEESQRRIKELDVFLDGIVIGQYDDDYVNGCSEFKDYNSFEEYVRDVIICLMESYPKRNEEHSRFLTKCNMEYIKSSFEYGEPAGYCIIEVGYCCG